MHFQLPRIVFEAGAIRTLPQELAQLGIKKPLLASDSGLSACGVVAQVEAAMAGAPHATFAEVPENPTSTGVAATVAAYRKGGCDGFVAIGGGSVIDTVKAAAACVTLDKEITDFLGKAAQVIDRRLMPFVTVPTTAGSGSEVSLGAGIHPTATTRSQSAGSPFSLPHVAICDPELTRSLPPRLTAATGIDALSHCIEGYLAKTNSPLADAIALDGIARAFTAVERAYRKSDDMDARGQMLLASVCGGISIHKGLGPAHALANAFGDRGMHHGTMISIALPGVMRLAEERVPDKVVPISRAMGLAAGARASDAIAALNARLELPRTMKEYGYGEADLADITEDSLASWFNRSSPYQPTRDDIARLVEEAYG